MKMQGKRPFLILVAGLLTLGLLDVVAATDEPNWDFSKDFDKINNGTPLDGVLDMQTNSTNNKAGLDKGKPLIEDHPNISNCWMIIYGPQKYPGNLSGCGQQR